MNYLGIESDRLSPIAAKLNSLLASYHVYYQNLRGFHWFILGNSFFDLHDLFEDYYNEAKVRIDEIAERILTIGYKPLSHLSELLEESLISEAEKERTGHEMAEKLIENHTILIKIMRDVIHEASKLNDEGTIDIIAGMLSDIEKKAWLLYSWKQRRQVQASSSILN